MFHRTGRRRSPCSRTRVIPWPARHDIIVLGASAGGVEALTQLVRLLPAGLPAAIFVVIHVPAHAVSVLPRIFNRAGPIPACHPTDGDPILPRADLRGAPDHHLLIRQDSIQLARGPRENGHRPAVDPLFRTAALVYGPRVVGVVLSGALDDGAAGLAEIKKQGGVAIVQSPDEALYPSMPRMRLEALEVDYVLPVAGIAPLLTRLANDPAGSEVVKNGVSDDLRKEAEIEGLSAASLAESNHPGTPSGFACPDCGGALWELSEGELVRFRCRVGHAWTAASLLAEQAEASETALWTALRALEERASLASRLAERMKAAGSERSAERFEARAGESRRSAEVIREVVVRSHPADPTAGRTPTPTPTPRRKASRPLVPPTMNDRAQEPARLFVVAIAASLGGLRAINVVLSSLPADFPGAILVLQHMERAREPPRRTARPGHTAAGLPGRRGRPLRAGTVYVAPPDCHLLVRRDRTIRLGREAPVQFSRPSADLLFRSVAAVSGPTPSRSSSRAGVTTGPLACVTSRRTAARSSPRARRRRSRSGMPGGAVASGQRGSRAPAGGDRPRTPLPRHRGRWRMNKAE